MKFGRILALIACVAFLSQGEAGGQAGVPSIPQKNTVSQTAKPSAASPKPVPAAAIQASTAKPPKPSDPVTIQDDRNLHMVAVEALVIEVNEERTRDLGLHFGYNQATAGEGNKVTEGSGIVQGIDTTLGRELGKVSVPALVNQANGRTGISSTQRLPGLGISLVGMNVDGGAVAAQLRALLTAGDATIRTRPIAVGLNGSSMHIETVNEVPTLLINSARQLNVDFRKVGVLMEVTPIIESLRPVPVATLDITRLEVSSVSNFITTRNVDRPVFTRSATTTKITLAAGETFVVGGLKTRRTVHLEDRVPILGDLWVIGRLFRSRQDIERNMDVLFFITPYILPPGQNFLLPFDFKNQRALGIGSEVD